MKSLARINLSSLTSITSPVGKLNTLRCFCIIGSLIILHGLLGGATACATTDYTFTALPNGSEGAAILASPTGVVFDSHGNLFVADSGNFVIRKITPAGVVTTFAGKSDHIGATDGIGADARFGGLWQIGIDAEDNLYVLDAHEVEISYITLVRKITPQGVVTTIARSGDTEWGYGTQTGYWWDAGGMAVDKAGNVYLHDSNRDQISKVAPDGTISVYYDPPTHGLGGVHAMAADAVGNIYVTEWRTKVLKITPSKEAIPVIPPNEEIGYYNGPEGKVRLASINALLSGYDSLIANNI